MNITTAYPHYSVRMFVAYSGITFITSLVIFRLLAPRLSAYFIPAYRHLSKNNKLRWNRIVVSQCFVISISCVAVYGFVSSDELYLDPIWGSSSAVPLAFGMVVGCMIGDIVIMFSCYEALYELHRLLHHIVLVFGIICTAATGSCAFFVFHRLLQLLCDIFFNFLTFFIIFEVVSPLYQVNGLLFTVMFFFCRIAIMPWYWTQFYYGFWSDIVQPPSFMFYIVGGIGLVLDIQNWEVIWRCVKYPHASNNRAHMRTVLVPSESPNALLVNEI